MLGIISYKDLDYWESIHPNEVPFDSLSGTNRLDNYEGCYIMLLGNPHNETPALKLVLDNYQYLNRRTKDVRFFMPGFIIGRKGIVASQATTNNKAKFEFFIEGFLETIEWLEWGNPAYQYSEYMEMILLPYKKGDGGTSYDFSHMLFYNLDQLLNEEKNIVQFITRAVQVVKQKMTFERTRVQMEGISKSLLAKQAIKVFIAGSKKLERERDSIRSVFSQLSNRGDTLYQAWTFEDFERSFTPGGRQNDYNSFIETEADCVVFILSDMVGGITLNEFNIAMRSFMNYGRPRIYVYCQDIKEVVINPDIQSIRVAINNCNQYYTEYLDINDLKNQIRQDFSHVTRIVHDEGNSIFSVS